MIGVVAQDSVVFAASVRDNIRYGVPDATENEVRSAARMARAYGKTSHAASA